MAKYFFPSCNTTADYPAAVEKLAAYLAKRCGAVKIGCCRVDRQRLGAADTGIVICNNCAAVLEESSAGNLAYAWTIIDDDSDFPFPDYGGKEITVQDCWVAVERREVQDAVRSLLKKMNFRVVEQAENFHLTKYSGRTLLAPCKPDNARLAPRRYTSPEGRAAFQNLAKEQQDEFLKSHCARIATEKVACYCKYCTDGINAGGKTGLHIVDLLFPAGK